MILLWYGSLLACSVFLARTLKRVRRPPELPDPLPQTLRLELHRKWIAEANEEARRRACLAVGTEE